MKDRIFSRQQKDTRIYFLPHIREIQERANVDWDELSSHAPEPAQKLQRREKDFALCRIEPRFPVHAANK
jgi:hypothetical protein